MFGAQQTACGMLCKRAVITSPFAVTKTACIGAGAAPGGVTLTRRCALTLGRVVSQDYGLDVEEFRQLVNDCPQRLLELAASCCLVGRCSGRANT